MLQELAKFSQTAAPALTAVTTSAGEDATDTGIVTKGVAGRETADPPMSCDGDGDVVMVTDPVRRAQLMDQVRRRANPAHIHDDEFEIILVNNPRPCETSSNKKYRPSSEEIADYRPVSLPAAVFQKKGNEYELLFVGFHDLCSPDKAEVLGRSLEKVAEEGARVTAPTRAHVPGVEEARGLDKTQKFEINALDCVGFEEEPKDIPPLKQPRKGKKVGGKGGKVAVGVKKKETKKERRPIMVSAGGVVSTNPHKVKSGNYYSIPHRNKVPLYNSCAICTAVLRRLNFLILSLYFGPAIALMSSVLLEITTIAMAGLPITSAAITINGWGNYDHLDKLDFGKFSFIVWFGIGDLSKVKGGTFLFPSWGLKLQPSHCTAI